MVKCFTCAGRGWIETAVLKDGRRYNALQACPSCDNKKAYYDEVRRRYGTKETEQQKINRLLGRDK